MIFQKSGNGYVYWNATVAYPTKKRKKIDGSIIYFVKDVPFEEAPHYWEYIKEGEQWNLYYIKRGINRRLAIANVGEFPPESIQTRLNNKEITVADCSRLEEYQRERHCAKGPKVISTNNWSVEFDGKSLLALLIVKDKMSYEEVVRVITNEGGYVDSEGIIHKGAAENKIREI